MGMSQRISIRSDSLVFIALATILLGLSGCDSSRNSDLVDLDDRIEDQSEQGVPILHGHDDQTAQTHKAESKELIFGFDLRSSPQEDARQYLPLLDYLNKKTGYTFKLRFTPKNSTIYEDLGTGKVHFASIGATSFIQSEIKYGSLPLVRGLNKNNKAEYQSMLVVNAKSPITRLAEIRGEKFAFGNKTSTQGHLIPRIILTENNIKLKDLAGYGYTGSHQNCANAVVSGQFDVCGMQDTMAKDMQRQDLVRIIHTSRYFPSSGIAVNKNVEKPVIDSVKKALLDFEPLGRDRKTLYQWDKTEMPNGFTEANIDDYRDLKNWMLKLDFIDKY